MAAVFPEDVVPSEAGQTPSVTKVPQSESASRGVTSPVEISKDF